MDVSRKRWLTCAALCIAVLVTPASTEGANGKKSEKLTVESISYYFNFKITNRVYNDSLQDPNSPDYQKMYSEVSSVLYSVFGCSQCNTGPAYEGVNAMSFSNGSVIAESTISFSGFQTNSFVIRFIFMNALSSNNSKINSLQIDPNSITDSYATTTAPTTTTTRTTPATTTTPTTTTTTPTTTTTTPPTTTTTPTTTSTKPKMTTNTSTPTTTTKTPTTTTRKQTNSTRSSTTPTTTIPTSKTTTATSRQSSGPPIIHSTKNPDLSNTTTSTTKSSSNSHSVSSTTSHNRVTNSSSNDNTISPTSNQGEGVPGWAIALLVLAAIAILLLIIIIIILLVRWCCVDNGDDVRSLPPQEHTPYMRTTFREPLAVPAYSPHTPQKNLYPFEDLPQSPRPKPNRTGMYEVNPER